jgi:hypothetical protein
MRLLQWVVSVILEGILLRLLDCDDISADDFLFTQKLRHHYILRSMHVVLVYFELTAYWFLRCVLLTVVMIHW